MWVGVFPLWSPRQNLIHLSHSWQWAWKVVLPACCKKKLVNSHKWPRLNFSFQYQYNIKQTSDENKEKYQFEDYKLIQYQILQTNITRTVWKTVRRITNEILGVKGLNKQYHKTVACCNDWLLVCIVSFITFLFNMSSQLIVSKNICFMTSFASSGPPPRLKKRHDNTVSDHLR